MGKEQDDPLYIETRESFVVRCLNSAANLYGIITVDEFLEIYNRYAEDHAAPISDPLSAEELERIVASTKDAGEGDWDPEKPLDDIWFDLWTHPKTGERLIVYWEIIDIDDIVLGKFETEEMAKATEVDVCRGKWKTKKLKMLPENVLLAYEDPMWGEESDDIDEFARILGGRDDIDAEDNMAIFDAYQVVSNLRTNGPSLKNALDGTLDVDCCDLRRKSYSNIIAVLRRVVSDTRSWVYRGHTQRELVEEGVWKDLPSEEAPSYEEWLDMSDERRQPGDGEEGGRYDDGEDYDAWDTGNIGDGEDYIDLDALPPPAYADGPFDFKKVKDSKWREKTLQDYEDIRQLTSDFIRYTVVKNMAPRERADSVLRLGFTSEDMRGSSGAALDMVAGDFAVMMDDQNGEPPMRRWLARKDKLERWQQVAAGYYENYRYTWLEVTSAKTGFGLKCHDLLTGKDLFLMEKSMSSGPNVKGMTICAGIAPMGEVCLVLGTIHPAHFENPSMVLKVVLSALNIPSDIPIELSLADQARFAAETIRRLHALGNFGAISYGG